MASPWDAFNPWAAPTFAQPVTEPRLPPPGANAPIFAQQPAANVDWSQYNRPTGEMKSATYTPTQFIGNTAADALMSAGMDPYRANDLTSRMGHVLGASPLGVAGSAMDAVAAKARGDNLGTVEAMAGMIPGVGPSAKMAKSEIGSLAALKSAIQEHGEPLFVRWSKGPQYDMAPGAASKDYQSGEYHNGLSALDLTGDMGDGQLVRFLRDYSYLRGGKNEGAGPHIYAGDVNGADSDGAPTIKPTKYIGPLSKKMVALLDDRSVPDRLDLQEAAQGFRSVLASPPTWRPVEPHEPAHWAQRLAEIEKQLSNLGGPVLLPGAPSKK